MFGSAWRMAEAGGKQAVERSKKELYKGVIISINRNKKILTTWHKTD